MPREITCGLQSLKYSVALLSLPTVVLEHRKMPIILEEAMKILTRGR